MNCKEAALWLDAYIDKELDLSCQLQIEQHLKGCAACASRLTERRSLQHALADPALRFRMPAAAAARLRQEWRKRRRSAWQGWWGGFTTAAALACAVFVLIPWTMRQGQDHRLVEEITANHAGALMAHHLTDIQASNQHVVKPWFNGRINFAPDVRDFAGAGFPLAGGRVESLGHRTVAALVYYRALHPIHLYTWPARPGETHAPAAFTSQGYHLIHWTRGGMTYWLISDLNEHELNDLAELLQR